ncbi:MAG TPA: hypothetical protein VM261_12475 [Kofleriaceae bacterium]|nr:hypothetical protein [Kofleriaceae bacterium]
MIGFVRVCGSVALVVSAAACKFPELAPVDEIDATIDAAGGDDGGGIDAATDAVPCEGDRYGFTLSNVAHCDVPTATAALDLSNVANIDSFAGTMTSAGGSTTMLPGTALVPQTGGPTVRVVSVTSLMLPASTTVNIRGENPIAFLVRGDAMIAGTFRLTGGLHPSSIPAGTRGLCASGGSGTNGLGVGIGGGGGGGALGNAGGAGGYGANDTTNDGAPGTPLSAPSRSPLWGGCAGSTGNEGTAAGAGGGAIQISAEGTIVISGTIASGGGGGNAVGSGSPGGGGGGSGGMLLLEAKTEIMGAGNLTANGGAGGGGGGGGGSATAGQVACDACSTPVNGGGAGGAGAGYGGAGAAGGTPAAPGTNGTYSGGGGGGGAGLIFLRSPSIAVTGVISPSARQSTL